MDKKTKNKVLYISTYPPRECGIATFTNDLIDAMDKKFNPVMGSEVLAMNDNEITPYNYRDKVGFEIEENKIRDYIDAARIINNRDEIKIVNIQHEYGIFGGAYGEYLLLFLNEIKKPVVVTLHTVTPDPEEQKKFITQSIVNKSSAIVVMANDAKRILKEDYDIYDDDKIFFIPHGVPQIRFGNLDAKESLSLNSKKIISTFGLINRGKGIEYVIEALPEVVKEYPNLLYLVIGETHPRVKKKEGEVYRTFLVNLVKKLGLDNNVKFIDRYLTLDEITDYLSATDIYIAPGLDENQIVSGTLSYALGCGKAIISTSTAYAKEVLAQDRGLLVGFKDPQSITNSINVIFKDSKQKSNMEKNAYKLGRKMIWPNVVGEYLRVFNKVEKLREDTVKKYPVINLDHLNFLTDPVGIIHHAKHSIPNRKTGYTLDDNARALIVAAKHFDLFQSKQSLSLASTYLSFLHHSQMDDGKFHNFMSYGRRFLDKEGSEDSNGRAIMACGHVLTSKLDNNIKEASKFIFDNAVSHIYDMGHLRGKAFSIVGLSSYYSIFKNKDILEKIDHLASSILTTYNENSNENWRWFEDKLTYSNGILPESLFYAYSATNNDEYLSAAKESLDFLSKVLIVDGKLVLVGNDGWFSQGGKKAIFDQQPVDAEGMVSSYLAAFHSTRNADYLDKANLSFNWFLGKNSIKQMVYDEVTGGCFDGLSEHEINLNQGAESTIAYIMARLKMEDAKLRIPH
jgi:glycosyltransferase involved in cell wall biosynthesis